MPLIVPTNPVRVDDEDVDMENVWKMLMCALEHGGSSHWCLVMEFIAPAPEKLFRSVQETASEIFQQVDYPLSEGGAVLITTPTGAQHNGASRWRLNLASVHRGLKALHALPDQQYWRAFRAGEITPALGNVFLQLSLWGKLYYS